MKLRISHATDSDIVNISSGEVNNTGMYNFKFLEPKPFVGGLFCQRIFGPIRDYVCECNKPIALKQGKCPVCGMQSLPSDTRRKRMGHINTVLPYVNPLAGKLVGDLFGFSEKTFAEFLIGRYRFKIVDAGLVSVMAAKEAEEIEDDMPELDEDIAKFVEANPEEKSRIRSIVVGCPLPIIGSDKMKAIMLTRIKNTYQEAADTISLYSLLNALGKEKVDYDKLICESNSMAVRKSGKESVFDFLNTKVLVCPPTYRDIGASDGNISYHPTNFLYLKILKSSTRIKSILSRGEQEFTDMMIPRECMALQKVVNMLIKDGATDYRGDEIPSLLFGFKGKAGRLRGNLLGKRVDFSGRSAITSGPHLPLDTLGLPWKMAYELLKPDLIGQLDRYLQAIHNSDEYWLDTWKIAVQMYNEKHSIAVDMCFDLAQSEKFRLILNRAPSLHRYSVQGFKVQLHHGKNIEVPCLLCSPFNADFDGDTTGVHRMLGKGSLDEMSLIGVENNLMSSINFHSPNVKPSHEMVVGLFHATRESV